MVLANYSIICPLKKSTPWRSWLLERSQLPRLQLLPWGPQRSQDSNSPKFRSHLITRINQGKMPALSSSNSSLIHTDIPIRDFRCPTHLEVAKMPFIAGWERFIRITVWTRARYRSQPEPPVIGHLIFHLGVGPKGRWENTSRHG